MPHARLSDVGTNLAIAGLFGVVIKAMLSTSGLETELAFYGAYHSNPWNQLIHFACIPCIWWSICVFLCHVPCLPADILGRASVAGHRVTWGTVQLLCYAAFYLRLDVVAGGATALVLLLLYAHASAAVARERAFRVAAAAKEEGRAGDASGAARGKRAPTRWFRRAFLLHAAAWYLQIHPGHVVLEGVRPALLDSLGQALGAAPMFALLEGAWRAGLLPEMHERVLRLVADRRADMCASGEDAPWC